MNPLNSKFKFPVLFDFWENLVEVIEVKLDDEEHKKTKMSAIRAAVIGQPILKNTQNITGIMAGIRAVVMLAGHI